MYRKTPSYQSGFSIIEVLIVSVIILLVFGGLFTSFQYSLNLISDSRAKMTALTLVNDRLEFLRSLPYDDVGTVSGIPSGVIPQNRWVNLNGINFNERVLIEFVDDSADGQGLLDNNGVVSDYKRVKVEYSWFLNAATSTVYSTSTIVPRSIETTAGGGSLRVNVFDANVAPLQNIDVRLINYTTTSTIDVTKKTDASGTALFTGAPASSNYEIFVSAGGFSSDQTHQATTSLPNPTTLPVAILESDVSTMNFQVDRLSDLTIEVLTDKNIASVVEIFTDVSGLSATSAVRIASGELELFHDGVGYEPSGYVLLNTLTPSPNEGWMGAKITTTKPADTDIIVHFYTSTSTSDLISEADLPGNLAGFSGTYIDLSMLDVDTFPTLVAGIFLSTTNTANTPKVEDFTISYIDAKIPLTGSTLEVRGNKTIGTLADASLVYKYQTSEVTDADGEINLNDIEWDVYTALVDSSYVIAEACDEHPFSLLPNSNEKLSLLLSSASTNNLRVVVRDGFGNSVTDADVNLTRSGFAEDKVTGWCGQAFFGNLAGEIDYVLTVSATGYTTQILNPLDINGSLVQTVILAP